MKTVEDPRLANLDEFRGQSVARLGQLVLQAAFREGLLEGARFSSGGQTLTWRRGEHAVTVPGRITASGDRLWIDRRQWNPDLEGLLSEVRAVADLDDGDAWRAFCAEIREGVATQQAAYSLARLRKEPKSYLDFEAWTPEGHNLHPGAKTRQGFSEQDQLNYGPEFSEAIELPWLAVSRELLDISGEIPEEFSLDDKTWKVPVHPWQLKNVIPRLYHKEWESGALRLHQEAPLVCRLCTSLRTVVPEDSRFPVLKTSVGSLMTSTERSMSRYTVLQGPLYSEYFDRIEEQAPELFENVVALRERGGFCFAQDGDSPRSRNLSLLFRQRPPQQDSGVAVPCSALPQPCWNGSGTYLRHFFGRSGDPLASFTRYLEILIPFHIRLYLRFGLALEAHLQNCVVVWEESGPVGLWVRDWGGLRADRERLRELAPDLEARLDARSVTARTAEAAEKKLIACLYCNHITEIVSGLENEFSLPSPDLWERVARVSRESFQGHPRTTLAGRIFDQDWPVKCLLKMRLGMGQGDVYRLRANPLRA